MIAGAADALVTPIAMSGFARMRALSTAFNDTPHAASRPFDAGRDGFVMGEGAGVLVLEEYNHAVQRDARVYAEVCGYGLCGDPKHLTTPDPSGQGAALCMRRALQDADLEPGKIDYVNAHATSTPVGDSAEAAGIAHVFGGRRVPVSSSKGALGHLIGAAGAVEAILTILSLHEGVLLPTLNLEQPEVDGADIDLIMTESRRQKVEHAMTNSFGFGGTNASLVFRRV